MSASYVPRTMRLTAAHVALLPARIEDPGPMPFESQVPPDDAFYRKATQDFLAHAPVEGGVWLFAFGSLIWNKRFEFVEERPGVAWGWHRDFCLGPDTRYRGNPAAPGYMLSLDRGGQCKGMVYRLTADRLEASIERLLRAEPPFPPEWVSVRTAGGIVRAFAFTAPRKLPGYAGGLSDEVVAEALARAVGKLGSMAEYVFATVRQLEELGLCDARLWRIQQMIAERIEAAYPGKLPAA